ncbi:(d)CMP kinase [Paracoccus sp. 11-3]|uniref:(D)CMP kinase n=1 Tax=Paracoccus amoyensis TaxID=2760093 RepID=A0A926JD56_9RHOB|nr:(d)CMP kinase [Paracoccus amoyensis]MBC9247164.1 (d)CMP kinase [Paracoccus amoyensis]
MRRSFNHELAQLIQQIETLASRLPGPFVVAIDGRSGSGKSTLAAHMATRLNAAVLSGDDFFAGGVTVRHLPPATLADICIDWRKQREVLTLLKANGTASYFPFDWAAFDGSQEPLPRSVAPRPVILFEGVYTARPELRDLVDLLVLVEVPERRRLRQLREREGEIRAWDRQWLQAEDWYFVTVSPRNLFDIILSPDDVRQR